MAFKTAREDKIISIMPVVIFPKYMFIMAKVTVEKTPTIVKR